jgi:hypothetical protein
MGLFVLPEGRSRNKGPLCVFGAMAILRSVAWKPSPGGEDGWIPTRTRAFGSGFCVSVQTDTFPRWRAVRLARDNCSATSNLRPPSLDPVLRPYDLPCAAVPGFAPVFRRMDLFQAIQLAN